ncbi:glutamate-1-semialdehyde aminotransferase [Porphyromonas crevioricanis]|uniref:glutamate-1-semialdehyde 2,1-aminomutase n=1 Tax=Porphyromonas crevioricanis TaxID=393921 RepID=UPI00052CB2DE|nr:glutamate-1-semialdehyde 2,1-aminomutase [Porphyromonas crevioricanis]KGN90311.1 glutamate-1-semialdehyde aminotransferase [Porphyromonas crevioricanis]
MNTKLSEALFEQANRYIPGGVNSPVRAFRSVGMNPLFIDHGKGSHIFDVDGNEYIDFISSWGPLILGHANPTIQTAIQAEVEKGTSYGACNALEVEMAKAICSFFPSTEKVRMVNSGTEATMSAIRLARGYTGRSRIIKFDGCYHGHADSFLINAGSGLATYGASGSAGVTEHTAHDTLVAVYNDINSVCNLLDLYPQEIAAVIIEPIMGNMGLILPKNGFLQELRELTRERGVLLIFDEVISGFRAAKGGAQELYGVCPDLTCLGKIIGGGLPVGAFGGRAEIMDLLSPLGPVYQAGTLSGNPLAMAAGLAMLKQLAEEGFYDKLEEIGAEFERLVREAIAPYKNLLSFNRCGSLCTLFFKSGGVKMNEDAKLSDTGLYARYFRMMIERGIYLPPSQFECMFLGVAHNTEDLQRTSKAMREVLDILFT